MGHNRSIHLGSHSFSGLDPSPARVPFEYELRRYSAQRCTMVPIRVAQHTAQYGVPLYLVPNLPLDMVLGHPLGYEHCVSHFARFNSLYSYHPVHPRFPIGDFREAQRTGKPFSVQPIHGKMSRQSVWGITAPFIWAVTPLVALTLRRVVSPSNMSSGDIALNVALWPLRSFPLRGRG